MEFKYKALNPEGKKYTSRGDFASLQDLQARLKSQGHLLVDYRIRPSIHLPLFSYRDLSLFSREAHLLLSNGTDLLDLFQYMKEKTKKKRQVAFYSQVVEDLYLGKDLGQAIESHDLPQFFKSSLTIASESNSLVGTFKILADHYENQEKIQESLGLAMVYPSILLASMVLMTQFLSIYVLPIFQDLFQQRGLVLPWYTRALFFLMNLGRYNILILALVLGLGFLGIIQIKKREDIMGKIYQGLLGLPLISTFIKTRYSMDFTRQLYLLLASGTDLLDGLKILSRSSRRTYDKNVYSKIQEALIQGKSLWQCLDDQGCFLESLPAILRSADYGADLVDLLNHTGQLYQEDYLNLCKRMNTLFEPVILLFLSGLVAFVVLSIASPMFELMNQI